VGEMAQALYAHMNNNNNLKKETLAVNIILKKDRLENFDLRSGISHI
jgi:hypothetical protein